MKIVLLQGEDVLSSRKRLAQIVSGVKKKDWQIHYIKKDLKNLIQNPQSLFNENILYILEKPNSISINEFKWLNNNHQRFSSSLLIYKEGPLTQAIKKILPNNTKVESFELPKYIYKFLESFYPGNSVLCFKLFHQTLKKESPEFILALLARHLRDLYITLVDSQSLNYPSGRKEKLKTQVRHFNTERIKSIIKSLAEADVDAKTGGINLTTSLDLIIAKSLKSTL